MWPCPEWASSHSSVFGPKEGKDESGHIHKWTERRFVTPDAETWVMWLQSTKQWLLPESRKYPERFSFKVLKNMSLSAVWCQETSNMVGQQMSVRYLQPLMCGLMGPGIAMIISQHTLVNLIKIWDYLKNYLFLLNCFHWELRNVLIKSIAHSLPPTIVLSLRHYSPRNFVWFIFFLKPTEII